MFFVPLTSFNKKHTVNCGILPIGLICAKKYVFIWWLTKQKVNSWMFKHTSNFIEKNFRDKWGSESGFWLSSQWFSCGLLFSGIFGLNETHQEEVDTLKCNGHHMVHQKIKKQVLLVFVLRFLLPLGFKSWTEEPQLVGHRLCLLPLIQMHLINEDDELKSHSSFTLSYYTPSVTTAGRARHHLSSPSSSSSSSSSCGTSRCSSMLRSQAEENQWWKWTSTVPLCHACF